MRSRQRTLLVTFKEWIYVVATFYDSFFIFVCGMWNRSIYPKRRNPELWWQFSKKQRQQSNKWGPYNVPDGPPPLLTLRYFGVHPSTSIHIHLYSPQLYIYIHTTLLTAPTHRLALSLLFFSLSGGVLNGTCNSADEGKSQRDVLVLKAK